MKIQGSLLTQIGVVRSQYKKKQQAPFQGRHRSEESVIEVFQEYEPALLDIEQCTHLIVLYWQDQAQRDQLQTVTPWGPEVHGIFSTRSPNRPNPIGLCVVDLIERKGSVLRVSGMDALDGSPVIDIKPYSSAVDAIAGARIGWNASRDIT
jgi:formylmethanofuran dehydrogenase subunit E